MNIVLDTNSLIDASVDDYNYSNRIIDEIFDGKITAFANRATIAENRLMSRRRVSDPVYMDKLERLFDSINIVESAHRVDVVEDPQDNKILESALESGSGYLVTSDNHLLKLENYQGVKIVTPTQFWSIYEQEHGVGWKNWIKDFIG